MNLQKALADRRSPQFDPGANGSLPSAHAGHSAGLQPFKLPSVVRDASLDAGAQISSGGIAQAKALPVAADGAAAVIQRGKKRGNNKQNKGRGPKSRQQTGPSRPEKAMESASDFNEDDQVSHYLMAEEGGELGAYEEEYKAPVLFWRGDDRGPQAVFQTGFSTKRERDKEVRKGANKIIWRSGGSTDDILPASAVCLAKDVRGSAFFPLTGATEFYMYAVGKTRVVNTFKAQQRAEEAETGSHDFRQEARYEYDPAYSESEKASAVWQFQEYAAHRVRNDEILACFKVTRRTLVPSNGKDAVAIAGIQFKLEFVVDGPLYPVRRANKALFKQLLALQQEAKSQAAQYENFYPDKRAFLSYMGIVAAKDKDDTPKTLGEAKTKVNQIQPIVVQEKTTSQTGQDMHAVQKQDVQRPRAAMGISEQAEPATVPAVQMKQGVRVNDDQGLEREADVMGAKAMQAMPFPLQRTSSQVRPTAIATAQLSLGSWVSKSLVSLAHFAFGSVYRVPKRVLNLAKHLSYDLVRAIYHHVRTPNRNGGVGLMAEQAPLKTWGVGLLLKIADIGQVRELIGFLTTLIGSPMSGVRGLSDEEKTLAREIFGDSMNLSDVTLLENSAIARPLAGPGGAFTWAHTIHGDQPFADPLNPANHADRQAILMHELMHIAQEQKQGIISWIELEWGRRKARSAPIPALGGQIVNADYNYGAIGAASRFRDFSREQQGAIIQDYAQYLKTNPSAGRNAADAINGHYGSGTYGHYQIMLQGLSAGHWLLPKQSEAWKETIG
ncbi:MAG: hypothetical protein ING75_13405 [Rhodocyclaceae bacterium]|nr:hypothetical protein [Rhodocyclaceae bacterium]